MMIPLKMSKCVDTRALSRLLVVKEEKMKNCSTFPTVVFHFSHSVHLNLPHLITIRYSTPFKSNHCFLLVKLFGLSNCQLLSLF